MAQDKGNKNPMEYALFKGRLIHIDEAVRGNDCNCICPGCGRSMQARKGLRNAHSFAHIGENGKLDSKKCETYEMSILHRMAEEIIMKRKCVFTPTYKSKIDGKLITFTNIELEQRNDSNDLQPDIVGITEIEERILIEIRNTHEVDSTKEEKIKSRGFACLEIDVRDQSIDGLENFLLHSVDNRKWINNPLLEKEYQKLLAKEREERIAKKKAEGQTCFDCKLNIKVLCREGDENARCSAWDRLNVPRHTPKHRAKDCKTFSATKEYQSFLQEINEPSF